MCSDRDTLRRDIESELEKSAGAIDPDYIDCRINELCELEARRSGLRPPQITEAQVNTVIDRINAHIYRRKFARRLPPIVRLAAAACIALIFAFLSLFVSNYVWVTKLYSNERVIFCCGTDDCQCKVKKEQSDS